MPEIERAMLKIAWEGVEIGFWRGFPGDYFAHLSALERRFCWRTTAIFGTRRFVHRKNNILFMA